MVNKDFLISEARAFENLVSLVNEAVNKAKVAGTRRVGEHIEDEVIGGPGFCYYEVNLSYGPLVPGTLKVTGGMGIDDHEVRILVAGPIPRIRVTFAHPPAQAVTASYDYDPYGPAPAPARYDPDTGLITPEEGLRPIMNDRTKIIESLTETSRQKCSSAAVEAVKELGKIEERMCERTDVEPEQNEQPEPTEPEPSYPCATAMDVVRGKVLFALNNEGMQGVESSPTSTPMFVQREGESRLPFDSNTIKVSVIAICASFTLIIAAVCATVAAYHGG